MYVKLFGSILTSSVWGQSQPTRIVWITLLALADRDGNVRSSPSGLARVANVPLDDCLDALACFLSPDTESGSQVAEGRRLEEIPGGWFIINYPAYRDLFDAEERRAQWRAASKAYRHRTSSDRQQPSSARQQPSAPIEAEVEVAPEVQPTTRRAKPPRPDPSPDVALVRDHFLALHPTRRGSSKDIGVISRALALGYSPAELCEAITGNATDPWHRERRKHELSYVLRDAEHIDGARAKANPPDAYERAVERFKHLPGYPEPVIDGDVTPYGTALTDAMNGAR